MRAYHADPHQAEVRASEVWLVWRGVQEWFDHEVSTVERLRNSKMVKKKKADLW